MQEIYAGGKGKPWAGGRDAPARPRAPHPRARADALGTCHAFVGSVRSATLNVLLSVVCRRRTTPFPPRTSRPPLPKPISPRPPPPTRSPPPNHRPPAPPP